MTVAVTKARRATTIWLWLSKVPPHRYVIIYALIIPTFAGLYYYLSDGFYAPYAHLERPWLDAKDDLRRYLEKTGLERAVYMKLED